MPIEGKVMAFKVTAKVLTPSGGEETYSSGPCATAVEAENEVKTTLKMVVGTTKSVSQSTSLDIADYVCGGAGTFEDMVLVVEKAGPLVGQVLTKTIEVENASLSYKGTIKNRVDETEADVLARVTAYRDGLGGGGYALAPGESYFKN